MNSIRIFNAYGTRVRTTGAYGAVFGVFFRQKLAGKPFTVVGDGTQKRDFLYVTDVASAFLAAAETDVAGAGLEPGRRQSADRSTAWSSCSAATVHTFRSAPASPTAPGPISRKITAELGWKPQRAIRGRREAHDGGHRVLARRAAVGSGFDRARRPRPGSNISARSRRHEPISDATLSHKIKTRRGAARGHRPASAQEEGDHVPRRVRRRASRATSAICSMPRARPTSWSRASPPTRTSPRGSTARTCRRSCAPLNLAAFEMVDYVVIDNERDAAREIWRHPARLFRQGLRVQRRRRAARRPQEELDVAAALRRRDDLHARATSSIPRRSSSISRRRRSSYEKLLTLMERESITFERLRATLGAMPGKRVHVVGDTIVDSYTHMRDDRRPDQDADHERALRAARRLRRRRRHRRRAPARRRRRSDVLHRARRRSAQGLRARRS